MGDSVNSNFASSSITAAETVVVINRLVLKPQYSLDDIQEEIAFLCENMKTYHSGAGFMGGFVALNSGNISNDSATLGDVVASPLKDREVLVLIYWRSFEDQKRSHASDTFQPLFKKVMEMCENGCDKIGYTMLWSGRAYSPEEALAARKAKEKYSGNRAA